MAAAGGAAGAGLAVVISQLISSAGDVTKEGIETLGELLARPVVVEFGTGNGPKLWGRIRRRKRAGVVDNRVKLQRIEAPLAVLVVAAYFLGWRPGGVVGQFIRWLFGDSTPTLTQLEAAIKDLGTVLPKIADYVGGGFVPQQGAAVPDIGSPANQLLTPAERQRFGPGVN